jgi:uncharacterized protein (TIGR02145 family)
MKPVLVLSFLFCCLSLLAQPTWQPDTNGDHVIDLDDFLDFLYIFGSEDSDLDGFYGPFDECPDEAGTLNGCPEPSGCTSVEFDGYEYAVLEVGLQCWFQENLRSSNFANGDPITQELGSANAWVNLNDVPAWCMYLWDDANELAYGKLYNGIAVHDERGLCPLGWHVPSDLEWMNLETELGMVEANLGTTGFRGSVGIALKDSAGWNGDNTSGLTALPGGWRRDNGSFLAVGMSGIWWSSSIVGSSEGWFRSMHTNNDGVNRNTISLGDGMSIRCVLDAE